jgi:hypothetical protein
MTQPLQSTEPVVAESRGGYFKSKRRMHFGRTELTTRQLISYEIAKHAKLVDADEERWQVVAAWCSMIGCRSDWCGSRSQRQGCDRARAGGARRLMRAGYTDPVSNCLQRHDGVARRRCGMRTVARKECEAV